MRGRSVRRPAPHPGQASEEPADRLGSCCSSFSYACVAPRRACYERWPGRATAAGAETYTGQDHRGEKKAT